MIHNRKTLERESQHDIALDCIETAIQSAAPETATREHVSVEDNILQIDNDEFDLDRYERILLVGGGKAVRGASRALEALLGDRIDDGIVIAKQAESYETIQTVVGDHPLPSQQNVEGTNRLLSLVDDAGEDTLILAVVTGGASALLSAPAGDVSLKDLRETTTLLLEAGTTIRELNTVRKHLSRIKGGTLVRRAAPATVVGLLFSDVIGDDPSIIASGPTVSDATTYAGAQNVFERYDITPPANIRKHLESGSEGCVKETPATLGKIGTVHNHVVGNNRVALEAAESTARAAGYRPLVLTSSLRGEAREVAKPLVAVAEEIVATGDPIEPPVVVLAGGETTVTVAGDLGEGGPNQELALSAAIEGLNEAVLASVDTDGNDGSSDVAGAIVDETTVDDPGTARRHLDENDAGRYLANREATIRTGVTGTNVNDIVVLVISKSDT